MGSSVKFGKFKWNRAGYAALMNTGGIQGVCEAQAQRIKSAADAALSPGGYRYEGHEVKPFTGKLANGFRVRTKTDQARYSEVKRKTLTGAIGGG